MRVDDNRSPDSKQFRFDGFLKVSYRKYLGDSNTTPDRLTILRSRLNELLPQSGGVIVVTLNKFDLLEDTSGTAPTGMTVGGGVPVPSEFGSGSDRTSCALEATMNGRNISAEAYANFRAHQFDRDGIPEVTAATQHCIDDVIRRWVDSALATASKSGS